MLSSVIVGFVSLLGVHQTLNCRKANITLSAVCRPGKISFRWTDIQARFVPELPELYAKVLVVGGEMIPKYD